jgi:hypothetical protein
MMTISTTCQTTECEVCALFNTSACDLAEYLAPEEETGMIEVPYIEAKDLPAWMEPYGIVDLHLLSAQENDAYVKELKETQAQYDAETQEEDERNDPCTHIR